MVGDTEGTDLVRVVLSDLLVVFDELCFVRHIIVGTVVDAFVLLLVVLGEKRAVDIYSNTGEAVNLTPDQVRFRVRHLWD